MKSGQQQLSQTLKTSEFSFLKALLCRKARAPDTIPSISGLSSANFSICSAPIRTVPGNSDIYDILRTYLIMDNLLEILAEIPDPEIPVINIVELGIVREARMIAEDEVEVVITPTYSACPAMFNI